MVTKHNTVPNAMHYCSVLAKILMVTKPTSFTDFTSQRSVLAKILMVTKPTRKDKKMTE